MHGGRRSLRDRHGPLGQDSKITIQQDSSAALVTLVDESTKKSIRNDVRVSLSKFQSSFAQFGTQPLDIGSTQVAVPKFSGNEYKSVTIEGKLLAIEHPVAYELI